MIALLEREKVIRIVIVEINTIILLQVLFIEFFLPFLPETNNLYEKRVSVQLSAAYHSYIRRKWFMHGTSESLRLM